MRIRLSSFASVTVSHSPYRWSDITDGYGCLCDSHLRELDTLATSRWGALPLSAPQPSRSFFDAAKRVRCIETGEFSKTRPKCGTQSCDATTPTWQMLIRSVRLVVGGENQPVDLHGSLFPPLHHFQRLTGTIGVVKPLPVSIRLFVQHREGLGGTTSASMTCAIRSRHG